MQSRHRTSKPTRRPRPIPARLSCEALECRAVPAVIVSVDAAAGRHAIDPNVYGTAFATTAQLADLNVPLNRSGGNAADTYSYQQDATNRGSDWFFESIRSGNGNGQGMDAWINETLAGGAEPSVTLNLFDWAARNAASSSLGSFPVNVYGAQQSVDPWNTNLGNGVRTNGTNITGNDPNIAYVPNSPAFEQVWVQHLIGTFGNSQSGGVRYYTLGNEPGLWNHTHRDIHPNGVTHTELRDRVIAYAGMVKSLDPNAKVLGFEEWGWTNYFISGADSAAQNWGATYDGLNFQQWMLRQLCQSEVANGTRLLDYFTLHFYPQGNQFSDDVSANMQLLRNRSTRSLWDPNYVDESWIASTGINGGRVNLINMMESWVNTYYPGTKTGITEYNWGAEGHMNGATTQADIWGIFGREGLDLANRWTTPATGSPTYLAMKMYRNYDGNGGTFGETAVSATVPSPDQVSAFAATRADGALTIMVVNKNLVSSGANTSITINLSNFAHGGVAREWQLAAVNPNNQTVASITHPGALTISGDSFTFTSPNQSVELFVIAPASGSAPPAPTGLSTTPGNASVTLSWNPSAGATTYNVYRGTSSGAETLVRSGVTTTTYSDTGLANETTYYYQVTAVNAAGESPRSSEVSATPSSGGSPPPPPTVRRDPFAVGAGSGDTPMARVYSADGTVASAQAAFDPAFTGGVRVALGDFNGDGTHDLAVATGPGTLATVRVFDGATQAELFRVPDVFGGFTGGAFVAAGDFDGDGRAELIVTPDQGGGPRVAIFRGGSFARSQDFLSINDTGFRGGARPGAGDMNGDGIADLAISAGFLGGPRTAVYEGRSVLTGRPASLFNDFFVFDPALRNGAFVAIGDVDGDGFGDLIAGAGPGGGPEVKVYSGKELLAGRGPNATLIADFFGGDVNNRDGIRVAAKSLNGDDLADIVTGGAARVVAYAGTRSGRDTLPELFGLDAFAGGVFVG